MTVAISIRPATIAERAALEALQWRASLMWEEDRDALLAHPDAIELPAEQIRDGRVIVAETNGAIAGFAVVVPRQDGHAELDGLFVDPGQWRVGIGTRLVQEVAAVAAANDAAFVYVIGNRRAAGFYHACGFVLMGEEQTRFGTGLVMRKSCAGQS